MDLEETARSYGFQALFMAFFTAVSVGITIGVFWMMNQTQFFNVDIQLFLDEFALPYFVASFALQIFNKGFAFVAERA